MNLKLFISAGLLFFFVNAQANNSNFPTGKSTQDLSSCVQSLFGYAPTPENLIAQIDHYEEVVIMFERENGYFDDETHKWRDHVKNLKEQLWDHYQIRQYVARFGEPPLPGLFDVERIISTSEREGHVVKRLQAAFVQVPASGFLDYTEDPERPSTRVFRKGAVWLSNGSWRSDTP